MVKKRSSVVTLPPGVGKAEPFCVIVHREDGLMYNHGECQRCFKPIYIDELTRRVWGGDELFHEYCWVAERADITSPYFKDPND